MATVEIPARVAERAATRYEVMGDCWVSTYSRGSHGYAQIGWHNGGEPRHMVLVHRAAWQHHHGPIPDGLTVDHIKAAGCTDRGCVRPTHLRLLTNAANASDNGHDRPRERAQPVQRWCRVHVEQKVATSTGVAFCRSCAAQKSRRRYVPRNLTR